MRDNRTHSYSAPTGAGKEAGTERRQSHESSKREDILDDLHTYYKGITSSYGLMTVGFNLPSKETLTANQSRHMCLASPKLNNSETMAP